jgi:uncharacterized protein YjbI with pentapeptide repeats
MRWRWPSVQRRTVASVLSVVAVTAAVWGLGEFGAFASWHPPSRYRIEHFLRVYRLGVLLSAVCVVAAVWAVQSWLAVPGVRSWMRSRRFRSRAALGPDGSDATSPRPALDWTKITSLVTSFTAVSALIFTALSLQASRDQNEVAQEGLITERYTRAVDQIGTPGPEHLQVRLGGVYALERLAQDSARDRGTIIDVLAAFIRSSSPRTDRPCPAAVPADIQAAFTVLTRRPPADRPPGPFRGPAVEGQDDPLVDLRHSCLTGIEGTWVNLAHTSFLGSDLSDANLDKAQASLTSFDGATMKRATLRGLHSDGNLFMNDVDLSDAVFQQADLHGVDFGRSNLSGADLGRANLAGADLSQVTHDGTVIQSVHTDEYTQGIW